ITIFPGELHVSASGAVICTVLGSCISVCLSDLENNIYGINHFMLPMNSYSKTNFDDEIRDARNFYNDELRYGTVSMEVLIGEMQKAGAARRNLKAKVFGGGKVLNIHSGLIDIGEKNIKFALAYLAMEKIQVVSRDTGDRFGRKIYYVTEENKVLVKKLPAPVFDIEKEEKMYHTEIIKSDTSGSVSLF
ncbi:MAG TPA: chemoreceptor glutamine deamidase CheD, partial [Spirochaetia bacterium]|nr:chemoreceptor glutamine deamidase CheD [Spirochaetia bacterium]